MTSNFAVILRHEESPSDGIPNANKPLPKIGSELIKSNAKSVRDVSYLNMTNIQNYSMLQNNVNGSLTGDLTAKALKPNPNNSARKTK